jgi:hypothetical protein
MTFRLKAFGLHLLASTTALTLILGSLYFGWYRWPAWVLTDVSHVVIVMVGVDVVLGPLLTFVIARSSKPRRELTRDIAVIVAVQLCALIYGSASLWDGRPLYYAFSENVLQLVQAYDIDAHEGGSGPPAESGIGPSLVQLAALDLGAAAGGCRGAQKNRRRVDLGRGRCDLHAALFQALGPGPARASQAIEESGRRGIFPAGRQEEARGADASRGTLT